MQKILKGFEISVDDGRVVGMQKDHSFGDLLGNIDPRRPGQSIVWLMQEIEEGRPIAELIDYVKVLVVLADSNKGD